MLCSPNHAPPESPDGLSSSGDSWFEEQSTDWIFIPTYHLGQVGRLHPAAVQIPQESHSAWNLLCPWILLSCLPHAPYILEASCSSGLKKNVLTVYQTSDSAWLVHCLLCLALPDTPLLSRRTHPLRASRAGFSMEPPPLASRLPVWIKGGTDFHCKLHRHQVHKEWQWVEIVI